MRLILILSFFLSFSLWAEVDVKGALVSDTHCGYFSTVTGHFSVDFMDQEHEAQWGDRVYLQYGFKDSFTQTVWTRQQSLEMKSIGPFKWNAQVKDLVASRGSFGASELDFVIRIEHKDGTRTYLNGNGSAWGYYFVQLDAQVQCDYPSVLDTMPVYSFVKN